jgi:hypothetical protein
VSPATESTPTGARWRSTALRPPLRDGPPRPWRALVLACVALAALSLLGPHQPTYDPWAWLLWGREIADWDLTTTGGPSWKPLPVAFTTVFSLFGDGAAPLLWLVVARAGGLLALAFAYRLGARLAGTAAGVIAAAGVLLADRFASYAVRGNSEGLLVAFGLWAVERHLDGRPRDAFLLGVGAALLRPELWWLVGLYGLWLVVLEWSGPRRAATCALVFGAGVAVALLWFVPEKLGSGDFLRGATRARLPVAGSPAQAAHPFLAVFDNGSAALAVPFYVGAVVAVIGAVLALRRRDGARAPTARIVLALAAISSVLMVIVAALAQAGYTGNLRYVLLPAAIVSVLAGVGWAWVAQAARARFAVWAARGLVAVLAVLCVPSTVAAVSRLADQWDDVVSEARLVDDLPVAIRAAGGERAITRCGAVATDPFMTPQVAWRLQGRQRQVGIRVVGAVTVIAPRESAILHDRRLRPVAGSRLWAVATTCRPSR